MKKRNPNKWFETSDGVMLDTIFTEARNNKELLFLIYPCVAGTTRAYMVPHEKLLSHGFSILEYHPRIHGKSLGQMSMEVAIKDLYEYLIERRLYKHRIIALGHSAGCNALLQLNQSFLDIHYYFLVQPVFNFREAFGYMFERNSVGEIIKVLSRWTDQIQKLEGVLESMEWLDPVHWRDHRLCFELDSISSGLKIGTFLENFYMPGFSTAPYVETIKDKGEFILSELDNWHSVKMTQEIAEKFGMNITLINEAKDHFLTGGWEHAWEYVDKRIPFILRNEKR